MKYLGGFLLIGIIGLAFLLSNNQNSKVAQNTQSLQQVQSRSTAQPSPTATPEIMQLEKPELTIDTTKAYTATLSTSEGDIVIALDTTNTPITANNFIYLAQNNYYDNTIFHRVIEDFMIQGGDPTGTGTGSPGYRFEDEYLEGEYKRGTVAMANSGPDTNGSQFFIMHADYPLPNAYVIFGQVTDGIEVVDKIATAETQPGGEGSKPVNPVTINSVTIAEE